MYTMKGKAFIPNINTTVPQTPKRPDPPSKRASQFYSMGEKIVDPKEVIKLLGGLGVHKAPGLDDLNAIIIAQRVVHRSHLDPGTYRL